MKTAPHSAKADLFNFCAFFAAKISSWPAAASIPGFNYTGRLPLSKPDSRS
jgi:hypothetical protein